MRIADPLMRSAGHIDLRAPEQLPLVGASILSADFARLGDACREVLRDGADFLHLDVMDGHFVPNLTMGPALCRSLRAAMPEALLDVHLMVRDPLAFIAPFADAGANLLTFHVEADSDPKEVIASIRSRGVLVGIALNPGTPVEQVEPFLDLVDVALVMSVEPGFSGQRFMEGVLPKVAALRDRLRPDQRLEMDGGLSPITAGSCREAGCDLLVAASAIFGAKEPAEAIRLIRGSLASPNRVCAPDA